MRTFADDLGREWSIKITAPAVEDVRREFDGLDLTSWERPPFEQLAADPELLVNVLWSLVKRNAGNVTAREFGESLGGDALERATTELLEAVTDFFPPSKRSLRRSLLEKIAAVGAKAQDVALAKLDDPTMERRILDAASRAMDRAMNDIASAPSSANRPATSGSGSAGDSPDVPPSLRRFG